MKLLALFFCSFFLFVCLPYYTFVPNYLHISFHGKWSCVLHAMDKLPKAYTVQERVQHEAILCVHIRILCFP